MPAVHSGVFPASFDPVCIEHIRFSLKKIKSDSLDRIFLVLQSPRTGQAMHASEDDRWKMLVAASSVSKALVPLRPDNPAEADTMDKACRLVQSIFPGDFLLPLPYEEKSADHLFSSLSEDHQDDLNPAVWEYCSLHSLYGCDRSSFPEASEWTDRLFNTLTPHRFAHSLAVALTARHLAQRNGVNALKAEKAGLLHDCAKCYSLQDMQDIAKSRNLTEDPMFLNSAALLHSVVGASVAGEVYHIADPEILEAIAVHNTGIPGMSRLSMCVCLADYIEPTRAPFPGLEEIRALAGLSLEKALLLSLEHTADHVLSTGKSLHPLTLNTAAWLRTLPAAKV